MCIRDRPGLHPDPVPSDQARQQVAIAQEYGLLSASPLSVLSAACTTADTRISRVLQAEGDHESRDPARKQPQLDRGRPGEARAGGPVPGKARAALGEGPLQVLLSLHLR